MIPGYKKPSCEKIDDILCARLEALEIPPETLEQPTSVGTLRDMICSLVEETLIEVSTQAKNEFHERQQAVREEAQRRAEVSVLDVPSKNAQTSVFSKYEIFMRRIQSL